jgi:hypothetical protein
VPASTVAPATTTPRECSNSNGVIARAGSDTVGLPGGIKIRLVYHAPSMDHQMPTLIERPKVTMCQRSIEISVGRIKRAVNGFDCWKIAEILLPNQYSTQSRREVEAMLNERIQRQPFCLETLACGRVCDQRSNSRRVSVEQCLERITTKHLESGPHQHKSLLKQFLSGGLQALFHARDQKLTNVPGDNVLPIW